MKTAEQAMGNLVKLAIAESIKAGERAGRMEQLRNRALQKWGNTKKALRDVRKVHHAVIHDNVKLMTENALLRQRLEAFEAASAVKIQAAAMAAVKSVQAV